MSIREIKMKINNFITSHLSYKKKEDLQIKFKEYPVSVIVPNYNYSRYLNQRLNTIINQTVIPNEIIFLDDCSSDDSVVVAENILSKSNIPYKIICNDKNQGVYKQWIRGVQKAKDNYIWIAEADDCCETNFLECVLEKFLNDENVCLSYCQSQLLDQNNRKIYKNCLFSTDVLDPYKWLNDFVEDGKSVVKNYLFYRNIIPNASAVVFKKKAFLGVDVLLENHSSCGDLLVYSYILLQGKLAYCSLVLNSFRIHEKSTTHQNKRSESYIKEIMFVKEFIGKFFYFNKNEIEKMKNFLKNDFSINGTNNVLEVESVRKLLETFEIINHRKFCSGALYDNW